MRTRQARRRALGWAKDQSGNGPKDGRTWRALDGVARFVEEHRVRSKAGDGDFAEFEREVHARLMRVEREIVGEELERADVDEEAVEVDGIVHRRAMRSRRQYMTAAGVVEVERTLFRDRSDPYTRTIAALDAKVGIIDEFWTPLAAQQASWVVSQMTPQQSAELFERVGNMTPSKASLDRLPKELHERFEMDAEVFEQALREGTVVPQDTASIAVSLDGVLVPMKDGDAVGTREQAAEDGKLTKGPAGYREASCATVSFCDASGEMISAIRFGRMPEHKKQRLKNLLSAQVKHIVECEPRLKVIKLADGAEDNWSYLSSDALPQAPECIDFYHAAEHLNAALGQAYGDGSVMARRRFAELRHVLLEEQGGVETVIRALNHLKRKTTSALIARELGYFRNNRTRMRYAELKARGFPVGSGVVEAACKTLVAQRMKQSGMRWSHGGGQAILNLRGWSQSGRFDAAWALLAATYKMQVTTIASVVRLRAP